MQTSMTSLLIDNLQTDVSLLKHTTQALRNENNEIKQWLTDLSSVRFELTKEVKLLKGLISQLLEQQNIFTSSLSAVNKETKRLARENAQIKSRYDIFQVRLKNLQSSQEREPAPKSPYSHRVFTEGSTPEQKDKAEDFQLSPRLENIINKATKDRLQNLRKDLEYVFKKKDEKIEAVAKEKEIMIEEWSAPSDLNTSESQSDRSQFTLMTYRPEELSFNNGLNQGQPSSLMEQVEILNSPQQGQQRERYLYESMLESNSPNLPRFESSKRDNERNLNPYHAEISEANRNSTDMFPQMLQGSVMGSINQAKAYTSNRGTTGVNTSPPEPLRRSHFEEKKMYSSKDYIQAEPAPTTFKSTNTTTSQFGSPLEGTQSGFHGSNAYSAYPTYRSSDENYLARYETPVNFGTRPNTERESYRYENPGLSVKYPDMMDMKTKKDLYLKGDDMLIGVLGKLEEQPKARFGLQSEASYGGGFGYTNSDTAINKRENINRPSNNSYDFSSQNVRESIGLQEPEKTNPNDTSTSNSVTSSKGTKRLKLIRKGGTKNKSDMGNSSDFSSN